jgi:hypothetical protein
LSLNLRAEYYNGVALNSAGAYVTPGAPGVSPGGYQEAQELTATVQYALWANVLTRLEFRWDHVNHGNGYSNGSTNNGEDAAGARQDAFMLAAQAIYTF